MQVAQTVANCSDPQPAQTVAGGAGWWFCTCCTANLNSKKTTSNAEDDEEMFYNPVLSDERMLALSVMTMIRYDSFENRKSNNE